MPAPTITPLPTPPSRSNPDNFNTSADAFLGALPTFATEANEVGEYFDDKVAEVEQIVANAGYVGTSATELTIGTGTKNLTTQTGMSYVGGVWVVVSDTTAPTVNYMVGIVVTYNDATGALEIDVEQVEGSGTIDTWTISLSGPPGQAGSDANVTEANVEAAVGGEVALRTDTMVVIAGTTHTLDAADNGKVHRFISNSAVAVTMPNSLAEGWNCIWRQVGTGQITFTAGSGATRRNRLGHSKSAGQYAEGSIAVDANGGSAAIYFLAGDTTT